MEEGGWEEQRAIDKGLDNVGLRKYLSWMHVQGSFGKYTTALHEACVLCACEGDIDALGAAHARYEWVRAGPPPKPSASPGFQR